MKMTKRIAAMAACAVMTVTSMMGMSASAADVNVHNNNIAYSTTASNGTWNSNYNGAYYNGTALVLLEGTSDATAKCTFSQVKWGNRLITGVATGAGLDSIYLSAVGGNGSVTFKSGKWSYVDLDSNGNPTGGLKKGQGSLIVQIYDFTLEGNPWSGYYGKSMTIDGRTYTK